MVDINECPSDHEKCLEEQCKYYDEECTLKVCDSCSYYNSMSGNCSLSGNWVNANNTWCKNGDFYNPYERLI